MEAHLDARFFSNAWWRDTGTAGETTFGFLRLLALLTQPLIAAVCADIKPLRVSAWRKLRVSAVRGPAHPLVQDNLLPAASVPRPVVPHIALQIQQQPYQLHDPHCAAPSARNGASSSSAPAVAVELTYGSVRARIATRLLAAFSSQGHGRRSYQYRLAHARAGRQACVDRWSEVQVDALTTS